MIKIGDVVEYAPAPTPTYDGRPRYVVCGAFEEDDEEWVWLVDLIMGGEAARVQPPTAELAADCRVVSRVLLLPAESMALTLAIAQTSRGEPVTPNVAALCAMALGRLAGQCTYDANTCVYTVVTT